MDEAYAVAPIRDAEQAAIAAVGEDALMQRAARGLADVIAEHLSRTRGGVAGARIVLLAGPGNNGGDGLFAAARLAGLGATVQVWRSQEQVHAAGWRTLLDAGGMQLGGDAEAGAAAIADADVVVDALLGIGGRPGLRDAAAELARLVGPKPPAWTVAVDVPSGIAVDAPFAVLRGADAVPHLEADTTVTFGGRKLCQVLQPGRAACGRVVVVDIGLPAMPAAVRCWNAADVASIWPVPTADDDKYSRGTVGIDTGSPRYPGAAVLSTLGALYSGAGFIRFDGAEAAKQAVLMRAPSVTYGVGRVSAWVLGCGWDDRKFNRDRLTARLSDGVPCVLDASALRLLTSADIVLPSGCLLTPHAGELARLLNVTREQVQANPIVAARAAADRFVATVLLKGATQIVATPGEAVVQLAVPGPAWTAQAGSGDTLAGVAGSLLAAGLSAAVAGVAAASIQALVASGHPGPYPPDVMATRLPGTIRRLTRPHQQKR